VRPSELSKETVEWLFNNAPAHVAADVRLRDEYCEALSRVSEQVIYLVVSEDFNDARVDGAFSTKEGAESLEKLIEDNKIRRYVSVEQVIVDAEVNRGGRLLFRVHMERNGDYRSWAHLDEETEWEKAELFRYPTPPPEKSKLLLKVVRWGDRLEDVVQIANEIRLDKIESGEWPDE